MRLRRHLIAAFSLMEVTLALGIGSFCFVNILGLMLVGLNSSQTAVRQTEAAGLAAAVAADLRATLTSDTSATRSKYYQIPIPASGSVTHTLFFKEDGTISGALDADADASLDPKFRATVVFTVPPAATNYFGKVSTSALQGKATHVRILITWPALADKTCAAAPIHGAGSHETLTALNR